MVSVVEVVPLTVDALEKDKVVLTFLLKFQCERKVEKCEEDFKEISKTIKKEFVRFEVSFEQILYIQFLVCLHGDY